MVICVGMQLIADSSRENGNHQGLGWIEGTIEKTTTQTTIKLPHMGWNSIKIVNKNSRIKPKKMIIILFIVIILIVQNQ